MIHQEKIRFYLKQKLPIITFDITDSTNTRARIFLEENHAEKAVFVANGQTNGRGRLGRSFYSPGDTGIYMTYAFHAKKPENNRIPITVAACVAVAKALNCGAQIKWVNDLYLHGKKICGILTESFSAKAAGEHYILVGIGVNLTTKTFPDDIQQIAGSINQPIEKEQMIARICDNLSQLTEGADFSDLLDYYRNHMIGIGESVCYWENGISHRAVILGIDDRGGLIVKENNRKKSLFSGEITFSDHHRNGRNAWE